jgi:Tfp pilus assembly protein PilO
MLCSFSDTMGIPYLQANRDSARRSKLRRKAEVEALMVQQDSLQENYNALTRQLSAAKERLTQLSNLNADLRKQAAEAGLSLPC